MLIARCWRGLSGALLGLEGSLFEISLQVRQIRVVLIRGPAAEQLVEPVFHAVNCALNAIQLAFRVGLWKEELAQVKPELSRYAVNGVGFRHVLGGFPSLPLPDLGPDATSCIFLAERFTGLAVLHPCSLESRRQPLCCLSHMRLHARSCRPYAPRHDLPYICQKMTHRSTDACLCPQASDGGHARFDSARPADC
jgi:hypothetical protein